MERAYDQLEALYHHSKRPGWGFAILAFEEQGARHYQFQDGQLRQFKKGWYDLIEPIDQPYDSARDIVRDLKSMLRIERVRRAPEPTPKSLARVVSFDDQVNIFKAFYPKGFEDAGWIADVRGGPEHTRVKRHRDAGTEEARKTLSVEALDTLIEAKNFDQVLVQLKDVLASTNLASSKDTAPLRAAAGDHVAELARSLRGLLYGEAAYDERFTRWVRALSIVPEERVAWPMATAPSSLVHPIEHVAIKPSVFRAQAQWMAPNLPYDATPSADLYARMLSMSSEVHRRLTAVGHPPRDYFDVHDFIWTTLRPKGRKVLEDLSQPRV